MFGQEARLRPTNRRSIEDHAIVRIGIQGRIVTIERNRASIGTVVRIAETIRAAKTCRGLPPNFAGAKVYIFFETTKSKNAFFYLRPPEGGGRECALVLYVLFEHYAISVGFVDIGSLNSQRTTPKYARANKGAVSP